MEIPTQLRCLFGGAVEQRDGSYLIEVPEQEIEAGDLQSGETYRVAVLGSPATDDADELYRLTARANPECASC
jgi:hypothetical protein